jgi:hypothetical protein
MIAQSTVAFSLVTLNSTNVPSFRIISNPCSTAAGLPLPSIKQRNRNPRSTAPITTSHEDQEDSWIGGGFRIVRVSEDRRTGNKQPAVLRSWHSENGEDEGRRRGGLGYDAKQIPAWKALWKKNGMNWEKTKRGLPPRLCSSKPTPLHALLVLRANRLEDRASVS